MYGLYLFYLWTPGL